MRLEYGIPESFAIPVPARIDDPGERAAWARQAVESLPGFADLPEGAADRHVALLDDLARLADAETALFLVISRDGSMSAPFSVYATGEPMSSSEIAEFLATPTALLPPAGTSVSTPHFGEGFSSTLIEGVRGAEYASRRWIFFGEGADVAAMLGPVVPAAILAFVELTAEAILAVSSIAGFVTSSTAPARVAALAAAAERAGDPWIL